MPAHASLPGGVATFTTLVDLLIPGNDLFPKASDVGVQHWLLGKAPEFLDDEATGLLFEAVALNEVPLHELAPDQQLEAVRKFERDYPALFDLVRRLTYLGYYQNPLVVRAVRLLGHTYNDAPQPEGYDLAPFESSVYSQTSSPTPRGGYKRTEDVQRVDLTGLDL